ncbi:3-deoxy-7-phosphoheptulonate synthase [bacterium]|nr:3-deoxy-7-phosphoheptulonate synthase [bacterium]
MILHLKPNVNDSKIAELAAQLEAIHLTEGADVQVLVTPSKLKEVPAVAAPYVAAAYPMDTDIQLASKSYKTATREVRFGQVVVGGNSQNTVVIGGPCSVESLEQITQSAELMKRLNISTLRAGCYKPRTSPYSFQGMGYEGLMLLRQMRETYGLNIITEVKDSSHVHDVIEHADIVQIGAKAMYDHSILKACGAARKPVLLKRGFGTTLQEFVQAAEFILSGGNEQVMLCERGIRTFETKTRFTLDLCGVAFLKEYTNLPVILDPSHAMGYRYGVPDLARACVAMGVEGLLIETHPNPAVAKSDASQQLNHAEFTAMFESLKPIAAAVNRNLI